MKIRGAVVAFTAMAALGAPPAARAGEPSRNPLRGAQPCAVERFPAPVDAVIAGFDAASCIAVDAEHRLCKARPADPPEVLLFFEGATERWRWPADGYMGDTADFALYRGPDASGAPTWIVANHWSSGNGLGVESSDLLYVAEFQPGARPLSFTVEDFGPSAFVALPSEHGCAVLGTEWFPDEDRRRGGGMYYGGRLHRPAAGALEAVETARAVARRLLFGFEDERNRDMSSDSTRTWAMGDPLKWLKNPRAERRAQPLATRDVSSRKAGVIRGASYDDDVNHQPALFTIALEDGTELRAREHYFPAGSCNSPEREVPLARLGDRASGVLFPQIYRPADVAAFIGRPAELVTYRDASAGGDSCPPRVLWIGLPAHAADVGAARRADLDVIERDYVAVAPGFTAQAQTSAKEAIARLRRDATKLDEAGFALGLARIAAYADNGHDSAYLADGAWHPALRPPFRLIWFPDALVVARAAPEARELLGASILTFEGRSPDELMRRLRAFQGGTDALRRWQLSWIIQSPEALHALGLARRADRLQLRLRLRDGRVVERTVKAVPVTELPPPQAPRRCWMPAPWEGETDHGWSVAADPEAAPLYLQQPDELFRLVPLPDLDALYLQFRSNEDEGDVKIAPFVASVAERLRSTPLENVVVDLRFDTGGDNTQNRELMRQIASTVRGKIYVLVGNYTFSAGIASAAALVHDGGEKVVIVGDEIADRTHWWSEGKHVCAPNAKVCFTVNTGFWDIVHGCEGQPACYGDQFDLRVPSLAPTWRDPLTSRDWLTNRDPALEHILADLRRGATRLGNGPATAPAADTRAATNPFNPPGD